MKLKKALCAVLAVIMLCAATGCAQYNPETVMTINGRELKAGEYLMFQLSAFSEATGLMSESGLSGVNILKGEVEGVPAREWIADKALQYAREYTFVEQEYERRGLSGDSANDYYVQYMVQQQYGSAGDFYSKNGIGSETFYNITSASYKQGDIFSDIYVNEESDKNVPDDELLKAFEDNFVNCSYVTFPISDRSSGEMLDDERKAEVTETAKEMLALVEGGAEPKAAFEAIYPKLKEIINEDSDEDAGTVYDNSFAESGLVNKNDSNSAIRPELASAVSDAGVGSYGVYADEDGYYVIFFHSLPILTEGNEYKDYTLDLAQILKADEFTEWVRESSEPLEVVIDDRAVKYYSPDKIKTA